MQSLNFIIVLQCLQVIVDKRKLGPFSMINSCSNHYIPTTKSVGISDKDPNKKFISNFIYSCVNNRTLKLEDKFITGPNCSSSFSETYAACLSSFEAVLAVLPVQHDKSNWASSFHPSIPWEVSDCLVQNSKYFMNQQRRTDGYFEPFAQVPEPI